MTDSVFEFPSEEAAQTALDEAGFSLGTLQRSDPRGVMLGDYIIEKWRNLSRKERSDLDGVYQREGGRGSAVKITMDTDRVSSMNLDKLAGK